MFNACAEMELTRSARGPSSAWRPAPLAGANDPEVLRVAFPWIHNLQRTRRPYLAVTAEIDGTKEVSGRLVRHSLQRGPQELCAFFQRGPLVRRELRLQHRHRAGATNESRQRERDAKCGVVAADRNRRALVAQYHLGNPCRRYADAILTGVVTLDDRDVGVANLALDPRAQIRKLLPALLGERPHRHPGNARGRPQEDLRGPVIA